MKPKLTVEALRTEARAFALGESVHREPALDGITDGKAIGTYFEHKFRDHLKSLFDFQEGSSAKGIDFPELDVDMKVTSARQPQSSYPYRSASQKIYGLGYALLVFVYDKNDDPVTATGLLDIQHVLFVESSTQLISKPPPAFAGFSKTWETRMTSLPSLRNECCP